MSRQPPCSASQLRKSPFLFVNMQQKPPCFSHLCPFCLPTSILAVFSHGSLCLDGLFTRDSVPLLCPIHHVGTSTNSSSVDSCSWLGKLYEEKQETAGGCSYCCLNTCKHKMPAKREGYLSPGCGLQSSLQKEQVGFCSCSDINNI